MSGSGGGYLSNEIAYRSLLLGQRLGVGFPIGHIHTPAVRGHDGAMEDAIIEPGSRSDRSGAGVSDHQAAIANERRSTNDWGQAPLLR